jgi:hypothetical protein
MPALVRVKIIAGNNHTTIVEYINQKYIVSNAVLSNHITQQVPEGFINYAWINPIYLTKKWQ